MIWNHVGPPASSVTLDGETGPSYQKTAQQPGRMQTASGGGGVKSLVLLSKKKRKDKLIKIFPSYDTATTKSKYSRFTTNKKKQPVAS